MEQRAQNRSARPILLLGVAACAVLMVVLSFLPWVRFESKPKLGTFNVFTTFSFSLDGTEVSRLRGPDYNQPADIQKQEEPFPCTCRVGFGDGYLVAGLGVALLGVAGAGIFLPIGGRPAAIFAIAVSMLAFFVSGFNALGDWIGVGAVRQFDTYVDLDGTVQPTLWLLVAACAVAAVLGAGLWSLERAAERETDEYNYDEETDETLSERAEG